MEQYYTQETYDALVRQLEMVQGRHNEALRMMGSGAGSDSNTWHDNFAFEQAKRDVAQTTQEVARLKDLLNKAVIVQKDDKSCVVVGSTVTVRYDDGDTEHVHIGGHHIVPTIEEQTGATLISTRSPLGAALMGHSQGDTVIYDIPTGEALAATIVKVE